MIDDTNEIDSIFSAAIELPSSQERDAYLAKACGTDGALRSSVQKLLEAHFRLGEFLESPAPGLRTIAGSPKFAPHLLRIEAGTMIGPFRVLRQLGEGGIGSVYLAEQLRPVRRQVALKVIKLGMDTSEIVARFEAERQALAMMDHPNVAKVFDAGATDTGRPYFVMELVEGTPITDFCDQHQLSIERRLELFVQICQAMQHAHQKGIIHRDIKPSNVLVSEHDGLPVAKVIDFGIAKATQSRLTEKTLHTEFRQLIGTPQYMSPEQAEGSLDIDTRTDVYSLGVLLYELLTGTTPFAASELRSKAYSEIERIIRNVDPIKPSTRLSKIGTLERVAAQRGTDTRRLNAIVRGELDWIVMKCLEKDRARRYETASALAADVRHYLADEPIAAAAPSRAYRIRKFVRRNRVAVIASSAVFVALLAGTVGTTIGLIGQARQRVIAEQRGAEAQRAAAIAQAVSRFQSDMLTSADPDRRLGANVTVLQVINAAVAQLDAAPLKDQPLVEAAVRDVIGNTLRTLGQYDAAEPNLRKALELRRKSLQQDDMFIGASLDSLGKLLYDQKRLIEAEPFFRESLEICRRAFPDGNRDVATVQSNLAAVLQGQGRYKEAEPLRRSSLDLHRKYSAPDSPELGTALNNMAMFYHLQDRLAEAEPFYREALAHRRRTLPAIHPLTANIVSNLAELLRMQDRLTEAEPLALEALEIRRKALPPDHPDIALSLSNLSLLRMRQGKLAEAEGQGDAKLKEAELLAREALTMRQKSLPAAHPDIAASLRNLGAILMAERKYAEAEPLLLEVQHIRATAANILPKRRLESITDLVALYAAWDKAEAGKGYADKAENWRQKLPATQPG